MHWRTSHEQTTPCRRQHSHALVRSIPPQPPPCIPRAPTQPLSTPRPPTHRTATTGLNSTARPRWWEAQRELWLEAHTEAQFWQHIDTGTDLIFVDFYATWCKGCQTIYPELCRLAADPRYTGSLRFVKVCVEELKALSKEQGAQALPYVQMYRPGQRTPLVGFQAVPSRVKALRANVDAVLAAPPEKYFSIDPNGFVMVTNTPPPSKASRAAELAALKASSSGLFDHLMKVATNPVSQSVSQSAGTPATPAPATVTSSAPGLVETAASQAKAAFLQEYGTDYGYGGRIDSLYPAEVGCRLPAGHHYLDYTGSSLYATSQLDAVVQELKSHVFGNPHSLNPSSKLTGDRVEEVRDMVRAWFNAPMADYQVVFTKSATDSLKLVGETFPWTQQSLFRYLRVNHNSVLGIRQYALEHAAHYESVEAPWVESWLKGDADDHAEHADDHDEHAEEQQGKPTSYSLFAFPAEDNFAGVKAKSTCKHQWKVLIDAAAYVPTQPLDLSVVRADFVTVSFYKMFGYPTGLGALLIRTENVELLRKVFWGGGSVSLAVAGDNFRVLQCEPTSRLEDGTVAFLDIIALKHGFSLLQSLGGMPAVQAHVWSLTAWTYTQLCALMHSNGAPLVTIFGHHAAPDARKTQGGILNFEILQDDGTPVSYRSVQEASAEAGFHLRTGAECNPGACYTYLGLTEAEVETLAEDKEGCGEEVEWITVKRPLEDDRGAVRGASVLPLLQTSKLELGHAGEIAMKWVRKPLGTVRVSLGYMSTFEDVASFVAWVRDTYTDYHGPAGCE